MKGQYYERLVQILGILFDCVGEKLGNMIVLFFRNAYFQERNPDMNGFIHLLVDFVSAKKEKISERLEEVWAKIFFKLLRLLSVTMLYKNLSDLHQKMTTICKYAWEKHRKCRFY